MHACFCVHATYVRTHRALSHEKILGDLSGGIAPSEQFDNFGLTRRKSILPLHDQALF